MDKFFPFKKKQSSNQLPQQPASTNKDSSHHHSRSNAITTSNYLHTIPEESKSQITQEQKFQSNDYNPVVKIFRPNHNQSPNSLHQLGHSSLIKMFDKYFQDQFDQSMNKFDSNRKTMNLSISVFEDYIKDKDRVGGTETQNELGIILETINFLAESKQLIVECRIKDQLIGGDQAVLSMVEGDIAKMAIREYENSQNIMRFICQENEALKSQVQQLKDELIITKSDLEFYKKLSGDYLEQIQRQKDINEQMRSKINSYKLQRDEIRVMTNHESLVITKRYYDLEIQLQQLRNQNIQLKTQIKRNRDKMQLTQSYDQMSISPMKQLKKQRNNQGILSALRNIKIQQVIFSFLNPKQFYKLSSLNTRSLDLCQRTFILRFTKTVQKQHGDSSYDQPQLTERRKYEPLAIQEDQSCKNCQEAFKQSLQLPTSHVKINTQMIANSQNALQKANDLINHYAQFLPEDYFDDEEHENDLHEEDDDYDSEEEDGNNYNHKSNTSSHGQKSKKSDKGISHIQRSTNQTTDSKMTISGFFTKIKQTFDDTANRTTTAASQSKQLLSAQKTKIDSYSSEEILGENLAFKSADKVYDFMLDVIQSLVTDRGKLAQLFKDLQQSYSQLFFYSHYLLDLNQSLMPVYSHYNEFSDIQLKANSKLKQENQWLTQKIQYESYTNKDNSERLKMMESRYLGLQAELVDHRFNRQNSDKKMRQLNTEIQELLEKLKEHQKKKLDAQKQLEIVKRERSYLSQTLREFKLHLDSQIQ